jgi:hypothetical protein
MTAADAERLVLADMGDQWDRPTLTGGVRP